MKSVYAVFLLIILQVFLVGTAQMPDTIYYQDKKYNLQTNPLDELFKANPEIEVRYHKASVETKSTYNAKTGSTYVQFIGGGATTACWRGYLATWKIENGKLYLIDLETITPKSVFKQVFPKRQAVFAQWYTGLLVLPIGDYFNLAHMGYTDSFEKCLVIKIMKGKVISKKTFEGKAYRSFRHAQFEAYKETLEYKEKVSEMTKEDNSGEPDELFLYYYLTKYTAKMLMDQIE